MTESGMQEGRAPLLIADVPGTHWDDTTDIVVVGFGCAGAVAALRARECGAEVIAIDRFAGGGSTAMSGGVIYAGGTRHQREAGFDDTAEEMYRYLDAEVRGVVAADTLRRFCDDSAGWLEWLESHGVRFSGEAYLEKTTYPPEGKFLYYTGNERMPEYARVGRPAPRGHRTVGNGFTGKDLHVALRDAALANGVRCLTHAPVTRLVTDTGGRVIGVEANVLPATAHAEHARLFARVEPFRPFNTARADAAIAAARELERQSGTRRLIRARRGVILCNGGYVNNLPMMRRYRPQLGAIHSAFLRVGAMGEDGSGIELGQSVGGVAGRMDSFALSGPSFPPKSLLGGIMVNRHGRRFINEGAYSGFLGEAAFAQPDGVVWLVIDGAILRRTLLEIAFPGKGLFQYYMLPALMNILLGGTRHALSIDAIARKCGVDARGLRDTLDDYNAAARGDTEDAFGKLREYLHPLRGSFHAINLAPDNPYTFRHAISLGGLVVDESSGAVLKADGQPVHGLHAAGRCALGVCSKTYLSGLALADAVFSGLRAAQSCASRSED